MIKVVAFRRSGMAILTIRRSIHLVMTADAVPVKGGFQSGRIDMELVTIKSFLVDILC